MPKDTPPDHKNSPSAEMSASASGQVYIETFEQRLLLSADLFPVAGAIELPGEEDAYVLVLSEATRIHVDAVSQGDFEWRLTSEDGEELAGALLDRTNGRFAIAPAAIALAQGTYHFTVSGIGAATGAYRFELRDLSDASPVTPGVAVAGELATGRETASYSVTAEAGERLGIIFSAREGAGAFDVQMRITGPTGQLVFDQSSQTNILRTSQRLPVSGDYVITVEGNSTTGAAVQFDFTLDRLQDPVNSPLDGSEAPIVFGPRVDGEITSADVSDNYRLSTPDGGLFLLDVLRSAENMVPARELAVTVIDTHGDTVFNVLARNGDRLFYVPPGDHLIRFSSGVPSAYSFALHDLTSAPMLAYGAAQTVALESASASAVYQFNASAGDVIRVAPDPAGSVSGLVWEIRDQAGVVVSSANAGVFRTTLAQSGTYHLVLRSDLTSGDARDVTFTLDLVSDMSASTTLGAAQFGTLAPGSRHSYSFEIAETGLIAIDSLMSTPLRYSLEGPSGRLVDARTLQSASTYSDTQFLAAGSYVLTILGNGLDNGEYGFRLVAAPAVASVKAGDALEGQITQQGGTQLHRIDLSDGETLTVSTVNRSGGGGGYFSLLAADGRVLTRQILHGTFGPVTAIGPTHYYMMVDAVYTKATLDYTLLPKIARYTRDNLALEELVTAQLDTPSSRAIYDFTLDSARFLHLESLLSTPSGQFRVIDKFGREIASGGITSDGVGNLFTLAAGTYSLEVFFGGQNTGELPFRLIDADAAPLIDVNAEHTVILSPARGNEVRRIALTEGALLYFENIERLGGNHTARLYDPSGQQVQRLSGADAQAIRIPASGVYYLVLEGQQSSSADSEGSYRFALWERRDRSDPMTPGTVVSGQIERPGDISRHSFVIDTQGWFHFDSLTHRSDITWELRSIDTGFVRAGRTFASQTSQREQIVDLAAGRYEIVVTGNNDAIGAYAFKLSDIASAPLIGSDTTTTVEIAPQSSAIFRLPLQLGDQVTFTAGSLSGTGFGGASFRLRVIDPQGNEVVSRSFQGSETLISRWDGAYSVVIDAGHGVTSALDLSLTLSAITPAAETASSGTPFLVGELVEGALTDPGATAAHAFNLSETTALVFDSRSATGGIRWQIEDGFGNRTDPHAIGQNLLGGYSGAGFENRGQLLLGPGTYRVVLSATGSNTGSYAFRLLDLADAPPIAFDAPVTVAVDPGNAVHVVSLDAEAGQEIFIDEVTVTGGSASSGAFQLIAPGGHIVPFVSSGNVLLRDTTLATITRSGHHSLLISGSNTGAEPFVVAFTLRGVTTHEAEIEPGVPVTGNFTEPREVHRYRFSLAEATVLAIEGQTGQTQTAWVLRDSKGQVAARSLSNTRPLEADRYALAAGEYEFELRYNGTEATVPFRFTLLDVADAPVVATPVAGDTATFDIVIPPGARTGMVQVQLSQGEQFHVWRSAGAGPAGRLNVIGPNGVALVGGYQSGDPGTILVPADGLYTFILDANAVQPDGALLELSLRRPDLRALPIELGATVEGSVALPGDRMVHEFSIDSGRQVYIDTQSNLSGILWELVGPRGTVGTGSFGNDNGTTQILDLPAGSYRFIVSGNRSQFAVDDFTGDFRFRLIDLADATAVRTGSFLDTTLSPGNTTRAFTFEATAGDALYLRVLDSDGSANRRLISPSGTVLSTTTAGSDINGLRLAESGTYLLLVGGTESRVAESRLVYNLFTNQSSRPVSLLPEVVGADLVPSGLSVTRAGGEPVQAGEPVTVQWQTENIGNLNAGAFTERLIVRNLDLGAVIAVLDLPAEPLSAGAVRHSQTTMVLPEGAAGTGALSFLLETDWTNMVPEPGSSAIIEGGTVVTHLVSLSDELPDLVIADIALEPAGADWRPGDLVTVSWVTQNAGVADATGPWAEQVRIRNTLTNTEILLAELPYDDAPIAGGSEVMRSFTFTWPTGVAATGSFDVTISTNTDDRVTEGNADGTAAFNNSTTARFVSAADLVVENLRIEGPPPAAGGQVTVVWDVVNQGNATTREDWTDRVSLRRSGSFTSFVNAAVAVEGLAEGLAPGERVEQRLTVALPAGEAGSGDIIVTVTANRAATGAIRLVEALPTGATGANNNAATVQFISEEIALADLRVSGLSAPASAIGGTLVPVSWTVTNIGAVATDVAEWIDRIVLSADGIIGNGDDIVLAEIARSGVLSAGESYTRMVEVQLPAALDGSFTLAVVADAAQAVTEPDTRADNVVTSALALTGAAADLTVEAVLSPASALFTDVLDVTWRVRNIGEFDALGDWEDEVFLSRDPVLGADDISLGRIARSGPLLAGESYTASGSFSIPGGVSGPFYLLVRSDTDGSVFEGEALDNNVGSALTPTSITIGPTPNLTATGITVPAQAAPGQPLVVQWSVENSGAGPARAPWLDRVFLSSDGTLSGAQVLGTVSRPFDLQPGESYTASLTVPFPDIAGGTYSIIVQTDVTSRVFEGGQDADNLIASAAFGVDRPDLVIAALDAPGVVTSGDTIDLTVDFANTGSGQAGAGRVDLVVLSQDTVFDAEDIVLARFERGESLDPGEVLSEQFSALIPLALSGEFHILAVTDAEARIIETDALNNTAVAALTVNLAPHADLAVTEVTAPALTIRDPATITVSWQVENIGTGTGTETGWIDRVMASRDGIIGNGDDFVLGEVFRGGPLALGDSYEATLDIVLPPRFSDRLVIYVETDAEGAVFEAGKRDNNISVVPGVVDIMPQPYADLVVSAVDADATGASGQLINLSWTVENQGIGVTDTAVWTDRVQLFANPDGTGLLLTQNFTRVGALAAGEGYTREAQIRLPDGIEGTAYLRVRTSGPFEFIFTDNNLSQLVPLEIARSPSPDLRVVDLAVPDAAIEGTAIDIAWRVENLGAASASGRWVDTVYLEPVGGGARQLVGRYATETTLQAGLGYQRTERVTLPLRMAGSYRLVVVTNESGTLFEDGAAAQNNLGMSSDVLTIAPLPRPNLQVAEIVATDGVAAGGTVSAEYEIINQGSVTASGNWVDRVYLSLDPFLSPDDLLLGSFQNISALAPGERYSAITGPLVVPLRFGGPAYIIVSTDALSQIDEFPNEGDNIAATQIQITPAPKPDLLVERVIAPVQAVAGAQVEVRFTVTNAGLNPTFVSNWTDSIWLARDPRRPSPLPPADPTGGGVDFVSGNSAILLRSLPHSGVLAPGERYEVSALVTIPDSIESGRYYLTVWSDSTDLVIEDTLAGNENPDDPDEIDSNNYRGRAVDILAFVPQLPNLVPEEVTVDGPVVAGQDPLRASWIVENLGTGPIDADARWIDRVYVSDSAVFGEPGAEVWLVAEYERTGPLAVGARYQQSVEIALPPSVRGQYVHVVVDAPRQDVPGVVESDESDNIISTSGNVTTSPADLVVTSVTPPADGTRSGAQAQVEWTVTNQGASVWEGTELWFDSVWISPDPVLDLSRATRLAVQTIQLGAPLAAGASYTARAMVTLPAGIDGQQFIHVITDSEASGRHPEREIDSGNISTAARHYAASVYEGVRNSNNRGAASFDAVFSEPDLEITLIELPEDIVSGVPVPIRFTITNSGTRDATAPLWIDRVFLSHDGALDLGDHMLAEFERKGGLAAGESYTVEDEIILPPGLSGPFYILLQTDSATGAGGVFTTSTVGPGLHGLRVTGPDQVREFQGEGNNLAAVLREVTVGNLPDLRVSRIDTPESVQQGSVLTIGYEVTNLGAATPSYQGRWTDLIYLSRDQSLDITRDIFLGAVEHSGGMDAGDSYEITRSFNLRQPLDGEYFVFVVTDRATQTAPMGAVYEGVGESNNIRASAAPVRFTQAPPADLVTSDVSVSGDLTVGQEITITWRVTNQGTAPATGQWSDAVFLSTDAQWDLGDRLVGQVTHDGPLAPGESYVGTLTTRVPVAAEGTYRFIVRADTRNQVFEDGQTANNVAPTLNTVFVVTPDLQLGVARPLTLAAGQEVLYRVEVPPGETLRSRIAASIPDAQLELFVRRGDVPTATRFDAIYDSALGPLQTATIGSTEAGFYYVLARNAGTQTVSASLISEILPFQLIDVRQDRVGDGRYVTAVVEGASFTPDTVLRLTRPGVASILPVATQVMDGARIVAVFDLAGADLGLYDVEAIHPDGARAVLPYRFLVERAIENAVGLALGGPRIVPVGGTGTYALTLQNFSNVDTPYVHFTFGAPDLGRAEGVYNLPFLNFTTNLSGTPPAGAGDVPWTFADARINTTGRTLAPGFAYDLPNGGFTAFSFNVQTYPVLQALVDRDFEQVREYLYDSFPDLREAGALDAGPEGLAAVNPIFDLIFRDPRVQVIDDAVRLYAPFQFHILAAATPMTRDEFIAYQSAEAEVLRRSILADPAAGSALITLAGNAEIWRAAWLTALRDAGILRAEDHPPEPRERGLAGSLVGTLAMGVLFGPEGEQIRSDGDLVAFFEALRGWYGHDPALVAELAGFDLRFGDNIPPLDIPVPALPGLAQFDLGLSNPTLFQAFNVFSLFAGADGQLGDVGSVLSTGLLEPLDLARFLQEQEAAGRAAALLGPRGAGDEQFVPGGTILPYEIRFGGGQNQSPVNEIRIVAELDQALEPAGFRLGDVRLGDIVIDLPEDRAFHQSELDLTGTRGYVVRVSAGIDGAS
ncbi:MAG TPA: LEPR-XLL domain-containing protein, partial [Paracoccus sp.]|nr:LEPR-XLL domain-containing protein [Paracoccus sp. (in: a-proteobacteria)]